METENLVFALSVSLVFQSISQPVSVKCHLHLWENEGGASLEASVCEKDKHASLIKTDYN